MGAGGRSPTLPASTRASRLREATSHATRPAGGARTNDLYSNPFARKNLRGPGGGRGGDFARPYEKRGPPGNDQRYFAKPSNKPYSPQVPPATLALLVSLQGAPWRTASDFRRQLVRAGHAPVPPVAAIDGALRKHAADYGIASRVDADGRRRFTVVDKVRAARTAAARRREAREAPCTSHAAAVAEASHARVEAAARSDALFERLSRRLAAAGVHLSGSSSPSNPAW